MDTMTLTKVTAGLLGAFLVFLLAKWAATEMYAVKGEDEPAYVIETAEEEATEEVAQVSFSEMLTTADIAKGAKVFKKCAACHKLTEGDNVTGPYLYGIVGRPVASAEGFGYSAALSGLDGTWTPEELDKFLTKPSAYAPGTSMTFAGLKKIGDRVNLIAYLDSLEN